MERKQHKAPRKQTTQKAKKPINAPKSRSRTFTPFKSEREIDNWLSSIEKQDSNNNNNRQKMIERVFKKGIEPWQAIFSSSKVVKNFALTTRIIKLLTHEELYETMKEFKISEFLTVLSSSLFMQSLGTYIRTGCQYAEDFRLVLLLYKKLFEILRHEVTGIMHLAELEKAIGEAKQISTEKPMLLQEVNNLVELRDQLERFQSFSTIPSNAVLDTTEDLRTVDVLPSYVELTADYEVDPLVSANIVDRPYFNRQVYLNTQFRLLREEFVGGLRDGFREFVKNTNQNVRYDDIYVYRDVSVHGVWAAHNKPILYLHFTPLSRINWEYSDRLLPGSLLVLVPPNGVQELIFLTVANRDPKKLPQGHIGVWFWSETDMKNLNWSDHYFMIESKCFYGAIDPVLHAIKAIEPKEIPFGDVLVEGKNPEIPEYLLNETVDISILYKNLSSITGKISYRVNEPWPTPYTHPKLEMIPDASQIRAIQHMFQKKVALVQGPPGTGKSFVGVLVTRLISSLLCKNNKGPILVICYTNHALDQFLEDLIPHIPLLVRLGGRSKSENEDLQKRNIFEVRKRMENRQNRSERFQLQDEFSEISSKIETQFAIYRMTKIDNYRILPSFMQKLCQKLPGIKEEVEITRAFEAWRRGTESKLCQQLLREQQANQYSTINQYAALEEDEDTYVDDEEEEKFAQEREGKLSKLSSNLPDVLQDSMVENLHGNLTKLEKDRILRYQQDLAYKEAERADLLKQQEKEKQQREEEEKQKKEHERKIQLENLNTETAEQRRLRIAQSFQKVETKEDTIEPALDMDDEISKELEKRNVIASWTDEEELLPEKEKPKIEIPESVLQDLPEQAKSIFQKYSTIWEIPKKIRKQILDIICTMQKQKLREKILDLMQKSKLLSSRIDQIVQDTNLSILGECPLVGMTSTQAATQYTLLKKLKPPVIIMEEAGELLESQTLACLSSKTQHLILIGDHQQLRPKVNNFTLEKKYDFHISLFERLINLRIPRECLQTQLRMRPEISHLVKKFYQVEIYDHARVLQYPNVKGVHSNIFFLTHPFPEKVSNAESKCNTEEARFIARFSKYLMQQTYTREEITVITPYLGQRREILDQYRRYDFFSNGHPRVVTVDDYQGDENKIILLSLVRSNSLNKIGFLKTQNRIIVSLSRAQHGFFIIGNAKVLESNNDWYRILGDFKGKSCFGDHITLSCQKHPETKTMVQVNDDFSRVPHGGCSQKCEEQLTCGHQCPLTCHMSSHDAIRCLKRCQKPRPCGHPCTKDCYQDCGLCYVEVEKIIPTCGHQQKMPCHQEPSAVKCLSACPRKLSCGHQCHDICGNKCVCTEKVPQVFPDCSHTFQIPCGTTMQKCTQPCNTVLECGHLCPGQCCKGQHKPCAARCPKKLFCEHPCVSGCSKFCYMKMCPKKCVNRCAHSTCREVCGQLCKPCVEPCAWKCRHFQCTRLCYQNCNRPPCNRRCPLKLSCKHRCRGLCGEVPCPPCTICNPDREDPVSLEKWRDLDKSSLLYELPDCGHVFEVEVLDAHIFKPNDFKDGHLAIQPKSCPLCRKVIRASFRYGTVIKKQLALVESVKKKMALKRQELDEAYKQQVKIDVIKAMEKDLGNNSSGKWFYCKNGHPYAIGECGGATQVSKCADCGEEIGGTQHTLLPSNRFASDFSNGTTTAYPGMDRRNQN